MFKLLIFVLIAITLVLMSIFFAGLTELHKKETEERKNLVRAGMEGYLDQMFGFGMAKLFKTIYDAEGNLRYVVYLPQNKWFKAPKYKWYEVYETQTGFQHVEIQR